MNILKEALPGVHPGKALDVGTRFGEFAVRLAEAMPEGSEVIGIDNDASAAEKAREKFAEKGLLFQQMDAAAMDYPDETFEVVALSNTLHHIEDYGKVLSEMLRVLKPGGFLVLNEMYRDGQDAAQQVHEAQHTLEAKLDAAAAKAAGDQVRDIQGVKALVQKVSVADVPALRTLGDRLRDTTQGVVVLASVFENGKIGILAMATKEAVGKGVHCGNIVKEVAKLCGGGGGGKPDSATAGGRDVSKLEAALESVNDIVAKMLKK